MAVAATAFLVAAVGTAITGGTVLGFTGITAILISGAVAGGLSFITRALTPKPKIPSFSGGAESGRTLNVREPAVSRKIIYGRTRVGGAIVFMESTGNKNEFLHIVIAVAGHEIDGYEKVFFNDELVWDDGTYQEDYEDFVRLNFATGDQTEADSDLVSESSSWTSDHKLLGTAYIYARLKYDQDQFPSGLPQITAVVRGKKVYDPRDGTTAFSQNPALCVNDYLTDVQYGLMEEANNVDQAQLIIAANECDESVDITGGSHQRYRLDGLLDTASSRKDNVEEMLTAMAGKLIYSGGKYIIQAGSYVTPTVTIDEDDIVGPITIQTKQSRRTLYNGVKGLFVSEDDNYVAADYPSQVSSSFEASDGDPIYLDVPLPFTTNDKRAQRLAKLALLRSRQQTSITIPVNMAGLKFKAGDNIKVTNARLGYDEKPFEVIGYGIDLNADGQIIVNVEAVETAPEIYDFNVSDERDFTGAGELPIYDGLVTQPPTNLTVTDTTTIANDGSLIPALRVSWTESQDAFVDRYEVQFKRASDTFDFGNVADNANESEDYGLITNAQPILLDYGSIAEDVLEDEPEFTSVFVAGTQYVIPSVLPGSDYTVRVRAINQLGIRSNFLSVTGLSQGDTTAPGTPQNLTATGGLKQISLSWEIPTAPDYSHVEVWENNVDNFSTATMIAIAGGDNYTRSGLGYDETKYYWVIAVDYSGNKSDESASAEATTLFVEPGSFSDAVNDLFAEAGAFGVEPVSELPASGDFDGQIKFETTEVKLYRWDETNGVWTDDIFSITQGSVDAASFAAGIEPIKIVNTLPSPSGYTGPNVVFLTTDNKLYRYTGTEFVASIPAADIDGALATANFPNDVRPIEIVSSLPTTGNFQGRTVLLTTDNNIYRHTGSQFIKSVAATDISGTISEVQIQTGAITENKIGANAVTNAALAVNSVQSNVIAANAVTETNIAPNSISTAKIQASAVTAGEIATNAVTSAKITSNAITAGKIATGAVTADKVSANAITSDKIVAGSITTAKIAALAMTADKIAANAITSAKISSDAITANKVAAGAIEAGAIAADAVQVNNIAASAVTADKIATNAVTANKIAADAITAGKIAAGAISTDALQSNIINSTHIQAGSIQADDIASDTITGGLIQAGAITADKVSFTTLSSVAAQIGQFSSAASGARLVIEDDKLSVFDSSGTLRVRIGNLS